MGLVEGSEVSLGVGSDVGLVVGSYVSLEVGSDCWINRKSTQG